jgi:hypothetical protein
VRASRYRPPASMHIAEESDQHDIDLRPDSLRGKNINGRCQLRVGGLSST